MNREGAGGAGGPDDQDLVARAAAGDAGACAVLFDKYRAFVLQVARRTGAGDSAEDLMSDVFLQLLAGRWRLGANVHENLQAFLSVLVWRRAYNLRRRTLPTRRGYTSGEVPDERPSLEHRPDRSWIHPLEALISQQEHEQLERALSQLTAGDRELLRLRYSGMSLTEIAAVDGRTSSGVFWALRRIHNDLAGIFAGVPIKSRRTSWTCQECGEHFTPRRNRPQAFCSRSCVAVTRNRMRAQARTKKQGGGALEVTT
jgi:RNA polymerase sigma factor (sigma-70 family)